MIEFVFVNRSMWLRAGVKSLYPGLIVDVLQQYGPRTLELFLSSKL